tara:strand:+ start:450 stop:758 length:309 start_codon:yes stop_codon:yes gene_type:complete
VKKFILILFFTFTFTTISKAETWSCIYNFNNESRTMEITRTSSKQFSTIDDGKIIKSKIDIIKETKDYIHLYTDFNSVPMAFVRVLDKNKKTFVMVGLEYQN